MALGPEIARLRKSAKLTQKELAVKVGVNQSAIAQLETGRVKGVAPDTLNGMAAALGVSADHFKPFLPAASSASLSLARGFAVRLVGVVGAGRPQADAFPAGELLQVDELFPGRVAAYRVKGESMAADGILDGDYVVVREEPEPRPGEWVIVWVDADGGDVLRRFKGRGNRRWLESGDGWRHELTAEDVVCGVYVGVVRKARP